jgi:hypothetical protein
MLGAPLWNVPAAELGLAPDNRAMVKWLETPDSTIFAQGEGFNAASEANFQPVNANFADVLTLLGYTNQTTQANAGQAVDLTLYWQVENAPMPQPAPTRGAPLSAFVHLVDGDPARKVAEFDAWNTALRGLEPGDVIAQRVTLNLPAETPANRYDLLVGLYSPQDGQRLATTQNGVMRDYAVAGRVEVAP